MLPRQTRRLSQNGDLRALCHLLKSCPSGNRTTISWSPSFWANGRQTGSNPGGTERISTGKSAYGVANTVIVGPRSKLCLSRMLQNEDLLAGERVSNFSPGFRKFSVAFERSCGILCAPRRLPRRNAIDPMFAENSGSHFSRILQSPDGFARFELRPGLFETVCLVCYSSLGAATAINGLSILEKTHRCPNPAKKRPPSSAR